MELGLFEIIERTVNNPDGSIRITRTAKVSNNTADQLQKILGQRIYDRMTGGAQVFELTGKSRRTAA